MYIWREIDKNFDWLSRYKNNKFKKSKNWDFSKGVSPWLWSKYGNFSAFLIYQK